MKEFSVFCISVWMNSVGFTGPEFQHGIAAFAAGFTLTPKARAYKATSQTGCELSSFPQIIALKNSVKMPVLASIHVNTVG